MLRSRSIGNPIPNPFVKEGKALVSKVAATKSLKEDVLKSVNLIGGFERAINRGDTVLLKPNYNSADPPPASTDPDFLKTLVELLYEHGAGNVVVGESSWQGLSTRRALKLAGALDALEGTKARIAFFDEEEFTTVNVGGEYLREVNLAQTALNIDKIVYSCCMKTHFRADFSMSLKTAFGFTKKSERNAFHLKHLKEKLVDLNLVVHPNLIIMDGRACFISGGPFSGEVRRPNMILASGDRITLDVESMKIIQGYPDSVLKENPWNYTQIKQAVALNLGTKNEKEYTVIQG